MKVYIGPYKNWIGPYQIADKLFFFLDEDKRWRIGCWFANQDPDDLSKDSPDNWLTKLCQWVESKRKRRVYIKLDKWDTWNMDGTLSMIVLPMLKQLHATKHGAPNVDDEDVPEELKSTSAPNVEQPWDIDNNHFKRWDWVMDELIWTFEQLHPENDWEQQYYTGEVDLKSVKSDKTYPNPETGVEEPTYQIVHGPKHTQKFDSDGYDKHEQRIANGLRLFGKYYRALWD